MLSFALHSTRLHPVYELKCWNSKKWQVTESGLDKLLNNWYDGKFD